jgi:AraC-like DNA-binding protein
MKANCPYCDLAQKKGELYCSSHASDMDSLESGVFFIYTKSFEECDWHTTRLSLNFNFDATQSYFTGNREYRVSPEKYLLLNCGQTFKTFARNQHTSRMVTVAFKTGLPEQLYNVLRHEHEYLLDHPDSVPSEGLYFFERTYAMDDFLLRNVSSLLGSEQGELNDQLEDILAHVVIQQMNIRREILSINKVKTSTKFEIYRRLHWALEYIQNHYQEQIEIDHLASQACLSSFHFKRLFKEYFRESPYQYVKKLRIKKASELLLKGIPVHDVCRAVGWINTSSFIRLFKKNTNTTPHHYRSAKPEKRR